MRSVVATLTRHDPRIAPLIDYVVMRHSSLIDARGARIRSAEIAPPASPSPFEMVRLLQRTAGNRAVASLLGSPSEQARALHGGQVLPEKPDHFPMGMGVAIPQTGSFLGPQADFDLAAGAAKVTVTAPTEPDWTIRVAPATGEENAYELDGFATISREMIAGGGDGQSQRVTEAVLDRSTPGAKSGAYRVKLMFPAEFHHLVELVEAEHGDDFRQAHRLMTALHATLVEFSAGLSGGSGQAQAGIDPVALERAKTEVNEIAPEGDDWTLVDEFAFVMPKTRQTVKRKSGEGTVSMAQYASIDPRKARIQAVLDEVDLVELRREVIEGLALQYAQETAAPASSLLKVAYDAMRDKVAALDEALVPPEAKIFDGATLTSLANKHWSDAYAHLVALSKQRDIKRWHAGKLKVRKVIPAEGGGMGVILVETGKGDKFELRQDSAKWIATSNSLYGEPVNWDLPDLWK